MALVPSLILSKDIRKNFSAFTPPQQINSGLLSTEKATMTDLKQSEG